MKLSTSLYYIPLACLFIMAALASFKKPDTPQILIFTKTAGFTHSSIPDGVAAIKKIALQNGYRVNITANPDVFSPQIIAMYNAVVFLNTTGDVLNESQQQVFQQYINNGGGYVGIHAAADTELDWPWYNRLAGAKFAGHPNDPNVKQATIIVEQSGFPAVKGLPREWVRTDEWYNYTDIEPGLIVLAKLDETTYTGGTNNGNHPIAWYHDYDGGRAFYTGGGHTSESYSEPLFIQHLEGGINYAIGK
jgi:type 1 glutamine amidotransferase